MREGSPRRCRQLRRLSLLALAGGRREGIREGGIGLLAKQAAARSSVARESFTRHHSLSIICVVGEGAVEVRRGICRVGVPRRRAEAKRRAGDGHPPGGSSTERANPRTASFGWPGSRTGLRTGNGSGSQAPSATVTRRGASDCGNRRDRIVGEEVQQDRVDQHGLLLGEEV